MKKNENKDLKEIKEIKEIKAADGVVFPKDPGMTPKQKLIFMVNAVILCMIILIVIAFATVIWDYYQLHNHK